MTTSQFLADFGEISHICSFEKFTYVCVWCGSLLRSEPCQDFHRCFNAQTYSELCKVSIASWILETEVKSCSCKLLVLWCHMYRYCNLLRHLALPLPETRAHRWCNTWRRWLCRTYKLHNLQNITHLGVTEIPLAFPPDFFAKFSGLSRNFTHPGVTKNSFACAESLAVFCGLSRNHTHLLVTDYSFT